MLDTKVSDLMTHSPEVIQENDSLLTVKRIFESQHFHHHLPVVRGDILTGMISLYDFIIAMRGATLDDNEPVYSSCTAGEIMSREVITCEAHASIRDVLSLMMEHHINGVPVISDNKLVGIVTSRDIMRWISRIGG